MTRLLHRIAYRAALGALAVMGEVVFVCATILSGISASSRHLRWILASNSAMLSLHLGETTRARRLADEMLQMTEFRDGDWNFGNSKHKGHTILGLIALLEDDLEAAKSHLISSSDTNGSPQLNSFGPNMRLAKALLEKGEKQVVLDYLSNCAKFWELGDDLIARWKRDIKNNESPDFGSNLIY